VSLLAAGVVVALLLVPVALAGGSKSSSYTGYGGHGHKVQAPVKSGENKGAKTGTGTVQALPFTGLDLGYVVLAGAALVGAGLVVRRFSRPSS